MGELTIRPLQWSRLKDLRDVAPLDAADLACLAELRAVLARHGRLERFAVHLLHKHFELRDDEVLLETSDRTRREHRLRVAHRDSAAARHATPTTWVLDRERPFVVCLCALRGVHGHLGRHETG
jgi:hypothetical protein